MKLCRQFMALLVAPLLSVVTPQSGAASPSAVLAGFARQDQARASQEIQSLLDAGVKARKSTPPRLDEAERLLTQALDKARSKHDSIGEIEALRELGNVLSDRGQLPKSLEYYQKSLALARDKNDKQGQAMALLDLGILFQESLPDRAVAFLQEALTLFRSVGNRSREAAALLLMARTYSAMSRYEQAQETGDAALALYQALNDEDGQANTLFILGSSYSYDRIEKGVGQLDFPKAKSYLERAAALYHRTNNAPFEGQMLTQIAGLELQEGRFDEARLHDEQALKLFRAAGNPVKIAYGLNQLGSVCSLQNRLLEALRYDQEALEIFRRTGDKAGEAGELRLIANIYTRFGQQRTALQQYLKALPLFRQAGDVDNETSTLIDLGNFYTILGDRKTASSYYHQALALFDKPTSALYKQHHLYLLFGIYYALGNRPKAYETLQEFAANESANGIPLSGNILSSLALVERGLGQTDKALGRYREVLRQLEGSTDYLGAADALSSIAEIEEVQGNLAGAEEKLARAVELLEKVRASLRGLSEAKSTFLSANIATYGRYLALLLRRNKPAEAFALSQKMKARALADILYDGKVQLVGSLSADERKQEQLLRQKSDALNYQLVKEGVQNEIGAKKRAESIKLRIEETERELQVFEDQLYAQHPDLAEKRAARTVTLTEVASFLPTDTALLEFVSLKTGKTDATVLFVVTRGPAGPALAHFVLPVKEAEIRRRVRALQSACVDPHRSWRGPARILYDTVILPAESAIAGKRRLLICPDGPTWDVPFAALLAKSGSTPAIAATHSARPLIERFEIDYAYSATGASAALAVNRGGTARRPGHDMLVFADPNFGGEGRFGDEPSVPGQRPLAAPSRPLAAPSRPLASPSRPLASPSRPLAAPSRPIASPSRPIAAPSRPIAAPSRELLLPRGGYLSELPGTRREAQAIRSDFKDAVIFTGRAAQERTFRREAGKYRYLHLATHGFFNDAAPLLSAVVLALPNKQGSDDGFLTAREIFDLDLNADLVVLSACNTARGEQRSGEGIVGLTWALFAAGAPAQIVSQWPVNDASTAQLMKAFYANLTIKHMHKGEALRNAALSTMRGTVSSRSRKRKPTTMHTEWSHPYYWAPFILVGDWR